MTEEVAMIVRYDPLNTPDPAAWLALDESERIQLVQDYHRRARVRLPNARVHASMHIVVENQIALGDEVPVRRTVQRLMAEGLDRHEAIHAVAFVLSGIIFDLTRQPESAAEADPNESYYASLERLTAESWRQS